jgi:hypothetical protein
MTDVTSGPQHAAEQAVDYLERLAARLPATEYHARLVVTAGQPPRLHVRNRCAGMLAEDVLVEAGWFWYSFAERIAPVTDVPTAAGKIARVLRVVGSD